MCGARGVVLDDFELDETVHEGVGFTVHEITTAYGACVYLADPLPVFVDALGCRWYVCWCMVK
jgi:hypothetical protein